MPAPSSAVLAACRAGTVQRHLLLYINHPAGPVRVWDGIGNVIYNGNTFLGVGGLGMLQGLSDSADIQQHEIVCTLNAVPLSALRTDDGDIRGAAASVYAVLLQENGTILASREVFTGYGDVLKSKLTGDTASLIATLRGLMADWAAAPRSYYTPRDQQRLYTGDGGFAYTSDLQDSTISGWSSAPEVTGGIIKMRQNARASYLTQSVALYDSVTGDIYGNDLYGLSTLIPISAPLDLLRHAATVVEYEENGTGAHASQGTFDGTWVVQVGGANCNVNVSDQVQTAGGALVEGANNTTEKLRKAGVIASGGTDSGYVVTFPNVGYTGTARIGWSNQDSASTSWTYADWRRAVFNNADGAFVISDSSDGYWAKSRTYDPITSTVGYYYMEDTTGQPAIVSSSGTGNLQVSGINCFISTTGIVFSNSGNRIIRVGGDPAVDFLRIWT